ncbi:MAG: DUF1080 domain-containing protein [Verrucomicrobiales bacterium]|nr:DUF1080 domain-containing protein [Verrucomicrobiales bacterium]
MISKSALLTSITILGISSLLLAEKKKDNIPVWTDPAKAAEEAPSFSIQGEYRGDKLGVQVAAMSNDQYLTLTYQGGLPNEGWDGGALVSKVVSATELPSVIEGLEKYSRTSPTMGKKAPEGALVIFDGEKTEHIEGEIKDGLLWAGSSTTTPVKDFSMHIEFRLPYKPGRTPSSQDRGNSGVYIFNNYEIQVLDTFGLDFNKENNAVKLQSDNKQWCGCFYKFKTPDVPMAFPPLTWQTYDIDFTAPRFEGDKKTANARITVRHNGVLIHDDVEMPKGTGAGGNRPEKPESIINIQGHGNPTAFRNFWIVKK